MPGDFCDMHVAVLDQMDHSIATISRSRVAMVSRAKIEALIESRPAITRAFWRTQLVDEGVLRAWIVCMGRRTSLQRVAHLLCELCVRVQNIGSIENSYCELPLSQIVLADALGLTAVHVNRVLRKLRLLGVMEKHAGMLVISDIFRLGEIAGFDEIYLHRRLKRVA
jgi:CRP-like cAMP-binding protein